MGMSNVDLGPAAQRVADLLAAVRDDELGRPTPCPEYSLGDLISAWTGMTRIAGGDAPAETVGLSAADELVVHGWDLARATGQPFDADTAALEAARSFLSLFASPDAPAGTSVPFGPSRPLPDDSPLLDQVISLAARDVNWSVS
jgi:hypothetical protein